MSKILTALTPKTPATQNWLNIGFVALILTITALGFIADGYLDNPSKSFLLPPNR